MEKIKLGEVVDIISGYAFKASEFKRTGVPVIRISDLDGNKVTISDNTARIDEADIDEKYLLKKGDLLIGLSGSIGKIGVFSSDELAYLNQRVGKVIAKEGISEDFAVYLINNLVNLMKKDSVGGTVLNISPTTIKNYEVYLPNKDEQDFISKKLKTIEILIQTRQDQIQALDDLLECVYYEMFGDPKIQSENSSKLKNLCQIITGNTPPRKNPNNYGNHIEWIKTDNILNDKIYPSKAAEFLSIEGLEKGRCVDHKSILITCIAGSLSSIGRLCITGREVSFNQQINALTEIDKNLDIKYLYFTLKLMKPVFESVVNDSMKKIINKTELGEFIINVPNIDEQKMFVNYFEKIEKQKQILNDSLGDLTDLFDSLMQDAFDGSMTK